MVPAANAGRKGSSMRNITRPIGLPKSLGMLLVVLCCPLACAQQQEHPDTYTDTTSVVDVAPTAVDPCASPKEGCPCASPGEILDCGQIKVKVDNYETCFEGSRLCKANGTWGQCAPDQVIVGQLH